MTLSCGTQLISLFLNIRASWYNYIAYLLETSFEFTFVRLSVKNNVLIVQSVQ